MKSGLKPAVKNRAAHGGEECAARMVKTKADALGIGGQTPICGVASLLQSPRYEGGSSIGRGVSPCSEYKKNMSPERAAEMARIEIVALFMPTCLSSAALVPRAHLFYILLPGAIELSPAVAGSGLGSLRSQEK